jgi:hypothetical protein
MKSPFDVDDVKMDAAGSGGAPMAVIDLEARPSALGSGLSQRLSALGQNLSHRISALSHQMDEHGLTRISAVKVLTDDKDTVTEPGRAGWIEVTLHLITVMFGAGVLGLPYAMASQGWALGICMLALATGASAYSAFLLAEVRAGLRVACCQRLGQQCSFSACVHQKLLVMLVLSCHKQHILQPVLARSRSPCSCTRCATGGACARCARWARRSGAIAAAGGL